MCFAFCTAAVKSPPAPLHPPSIGKACRMTRTAAPAIPKPLFCSRFMGMTVSQASRRQQVALGRSGRSGIRVPFWCASSTSRLYGGRLRTGWCCTVLPLATAIVLIARCWRCPFGPTCPRRTWPRSSGSVQRRASWRLPLAPGGRCSQRAFSPRCGGRERAEVEMGAARLPRRSAKGRYDLFIRSRLWRVPDRSLLAGHALAKVVLSVVLVRH